MCIRDSTHPVRVLTDFWIDQLGVDLRGDDGLVPEDFLQGFKPVSYTHLESR